MGYKWGFYKFPVDPVLNATQIETNWRPVQAESFASATKGPSDELLKSVVIDLSKPLKEQLERLKQHVIIAQRRLKKQGRLFPFTIAGKKSLWVQCLRLLDAQCDNQSISQIQTLFQKEDPDCDFDLVQNETAHTKKNIWIY